VKLGGAMAQSEGLEDGVPQWGRCVEPRYEVWGTKSSRSWSISAYTTINFANTWKDMVPLKLLHFGEFKIAVYAFQQLHTFTLCQGHSQ